jgi:hypothetical protein
VPDENPKGPGSRRPDDLRRAVDTATHFETQFPTFSARHRQQLAALVHLAPELVNEYWKELRDGRVPSEREAAQADGAVAAVDRMAERIRKATERPTDRNAAVEPPRCVVCDAPAVWELRLNHADGGADAHVGVCREHCGVDALLSHGVTAVYGPCSKMPTPETVGSLEHGQQWSRIRSCSSINGNEYGGLELDGRMILADRDETVGSSGAPASSVVVIAARVFLVAQGHTDLHAIDAVLSRVPLLLFRAFVETPEQAARETPDPWLNGVPTNAKYLAVNRPGRLETGNPKPRSPSRRQRDAAKREKARGRAIARPYPLVMVRALRGTIAEALVPASSASHE